MTTKQLKNYLDKQLQHYDHDGFVPDDPIAIPHRFDLPADIEIAGFFAALFAWGNRATIIKKCSALLELMDNAPFQFVMQHQEADLKPLDSFKHRTFTGIDIRYFIRFFKHHYQKHNSLESAFTAGIAIEQAYTVEPALAHFHTYFFNLPDAPQRTRKHIATPMTGSACKRLNMYLRWMVRPNTTGIDFGLWEQLKPHQLVCPLDVHVVRVALNLQLINRATADWNTALELTERLKQLDPNDPVKYDIALFSLGVNQIVE